MKHVRIALALVAVALLAVPSAATAAKHHVKKCPSGKHRNGKRCAKNHTAAARTPATTGTGSAGATGPAGPAGPSGPSGATGPAGPTGQPPVITRSIVYDNIASLPANPSSYGFAALDFDELGSLVGLAGTNRDNPVVTVDMSVYSCQTGTYVSGCSTTPGTKFEVPMTVRVYAVGSNQEPGALIGTETVDQQLFYRPSADASCTTAPYAGGFRNASDECVNGELEPVSFNLAGVTLPNQVIVSLSYDTSTSGYGQNTPAGPADSLNVALAGPAAVGTTLRESEGSYFASGEYGSGNDVFQYQEDEDTGESEGYEPAIAISATN